MDTKKIAKEEIKIKRGRLYVALALVFVAGAILGQGIGQMQQYNAVEIFLIQHADTGYTFEMAGKGFFEIHHVNATLTANGTVQIGNLCYKTNNYNMTKVPCPYGGK